MVSLSCLHVHMSNLKLKLVRQNIAVADEPSQLFWWTNLSLNHKPKPTNIYVSVSTVGRMVKKMKIVCCLWDAEHMEPWSPPPPHSIQGHQRRLSRDVHLPVNSQGWRDHQDKVKRSRRGGMIRRSLMWSHKLQHFSSNGPKIDNPLVPPCSNYSSATEHSTQFLKTPMRTHREEKHQASISNGHPSRLMFFMSLWLSSSFQCGLTTSAFFVTTWPGTGSRLFSGPPIIWKTS